MKRVVMAAAVVVTTFGCGSDSTGPSTTYENISGTYVGVMAGISQGVTLDATFTLTITQNQGTLGGSYSLSGTLSDGIDVVAVQGTGTLSGSIAPGSNPSVNVTVTSGICPSVSSTYSGAYDSANHVITLNGSAKMFNASCQVVLTYTGTIILSR
jgi:hypothetical protein